MNRKEMTCTAVAALLGTAGCSSPMKSLAIPAGNAEEAGATIREVASGRIAPHVGEVLLSLISGTKQDIGSAVFRLSPDSGWSITSNDPRLHVSIEHGHVATLLAPEDKKVQFQARATISHADGTHFDVRCHVEADCSG